MVEHASHMPEPKKRQGKIGALLGGKQMEWSRDDANLSLVQRAGKIPPYQLVGYAVCVVLTFIALLFAVSGGDIVGPASNWIVILLAISGVGISFLAITVWQRLTNLARAGREAQTGAKLHLRFVSLFALAGVIPAIVIALFSGLTIQRGVQAWFTDKIRDAVEATRRFGNDSIDKAGELIKIDLAAMAVDLNASATQLRADPVAFRGYLGDQADRRGFVAVYVLDGQGNRIAMAQRPTGVPTFIAPDREDFNNADAGDVDVNQDDKAILRALYRLDGFNNSYIAAVRLPEAGQLELFQKGGNAVRAYAAIEDRQGRLQVIFALAYFEIVFLVMIGSAWFGFSGANQRAHWPSRSSC
jgi:two-component system, NtrC family, nitrogen regulation sensor histidine kinase NtrY